MTDFARQSEMTDACVVPRQQLASTIPGMAHFAGSGPDGKTCGGCDHWIVIGRKTICEKYKSLTGDSKKMIPVTTPACRHFVERPKS